MRYHTDMKKKRLIIAILCMLAAAGAAVAVALLTPARLVSGAENKIALYTRNKPEAELTVAVVTADDVTIRAYGHDGKEISVPDRYYELGPVTRTFTGAVTAKAVEDGVLNLQSPVSSFLTLASGTYCPMVQDLLTHSSAYADYAPGVSLSKKTNPYSGITGTDIVSDMSSFILKYPAPYLYADSDFGVAALSTVLAKAYNVDYYSILTLFIRNALGLENTYVAVEGTIADGWQWNYDDAYIADLGLTSNISDMTEYVRILLAEPNAFIHRACDALYEVNADLHTGYFWNISPKDWILSQSGSTGHYAAAVSVDKNRGIGVVVLSNYADDRYGTAGEIADAVLQEAGESAAVVTE